MFKKVALITVGLLLFVVLCAGLAQLIPVNHTNPPVVREPNWNSPETRALAKRACFDCHSNETVWPYYSKIAPISWMIANSVGEGRQKLNYSDWNQYSENESVEAVLKGEMPPTPYLWMHPNARLTQQERHTLASGLTATFGGNRGGGNRGGSERGGVGDFGRGGDDD